MGNKWLENILSPQSLAYISVHAGVMRHTMKTLLSILFLLLSVFLSGQTKDSVLYGFRHLQTTYKNDTVDILIKSKIGEEQKEKPLFLFSQGSMPIPLMIRHYEDGKSSIYNVFPFTDLESLLEKYHIGIIGKPCIPLVVDEKLLNNDMTYSDSTGAFSREYVKRNLLSYYVDRNNKIIDFLFTLPYISKKNLVAAGHSEGSAIAAKLAYSNRRITKLIYSGGNPLGRIMTIIARARTNESDSSRQSRPVFQGWETIVNAPNAIDGFGDTNKGTFEFSHPKPMDYLLKLKIPVLVSYGTKDYGLINSVDYFRLETIRQQKQNFTFKDYIGLDHNYFEVGLNAEINYENHHWDRIVSKDWVDWLKN